MPTKQRVSSSMPNVPASPEAPLARLHRSTPTPMSIQRERRSASRPNTGAPSMYVTMNAIDSTPMSAFSGLKPRCCWHQASRESSDALLVVPVRAEESLLELGHHRRQHLAVDVVEQVDQQQQHQRRARALERRTLWSGLASGRGRGGGSLAGRAGVTGVRHHIHLLCEFHGLTLTTRQPMVVIENNCSIIYPDRYRPDAQSPSPGEGNILSSQPRIQHG